MELREWLIILGLVLVTIIVIDGVRRLQRQRKVPRLDRADASGESEGTSAERAERSVPETDPEEAARQAELNWELPNGGARVVKPASQPTVAPKPKLQRQDHPGPSKVFSRMAQQQEAAPPQRHATARANEPPREASSARHEDPSQRSGMSATLRSGMQRMSSAFHGQEETRAPRHQEPSLGDTGVTRSAEPERQAPFAPGRRPAPEPRREQVPDEAASASNAASHAVSEPRPEPKPEPEPEPKIRRESEPLTPRTSDARPAAQQAPQPAPPRQEQPEQSEPVPEPERQDDVVTPHPVVEKARRHHVSARRARETLAHAEEIIVISVMARNDGEFAGPDLLKLMLACGLRYSEMGIFLRYETEEDDSELQFAMVDVVKPGTFDLETMDDFTTTGVTFLMPLPGAEDASAAFEAMVETAMVLVRNLGGELKDENRSVMTAQTVEFARQRVQEFGRRHRLHRYQVN